MRRFILAALFAALCAATASAQQSASDDDDYPKAEGFSHYRAAGGGAVGFNGFEAAVTANVSRLVGFKFDLSGHYRTDFGERVSVYNYVGGVQLKHNSRAARRKPFAHLLAGGALDPLGADVVGEEDVTPSRPMPSDHAGVVASFVLQP